MLWFVEHSWSGSVGLVLYYELLVEVEVELGVEAVLVLASPCILT